jgi:hypothetical protein
MSESETEHDIRDEDLPEDLQPSDDNPLAKDLSEAEDPKSPEELDMQGGKGPDGRDPAEGDEDDSEE